MDKILIVDDDKGILNLLKRTLEKDGYEVHVMEEIQRVKIEMFKGYNLVLLDIMMPGLDGFEICSSIREEIDCPIIFISAKSMEGDIISGLGVGADDYITKPFGIKEIRARVGAHIRREKREKKMGIKVSGIFFDVGGKRASVGDRPISFTKGEYSICYFLARNRGLVFSKERIYEKVFGFNGESDSSCIAEHIKNIRSKLRDFQMNPIETVWGIGYKWK